MFKASIFRRVPLLFVVLSLGALHHVRVSCVASGMSLDSLPVSAHLPWTFALNVQIRVPISGYNSGFWWAQGQRSQEIPGPAGMQLEFSRTV